jgi:hypothetical protein
MADTPSTAPPPQPAPQDPQDGGDIQRPGADASSSSVGTLKAPAYGRERFLLLRQKWLTPMGPPRPVPADQLDEDTIIEAICNCPGDILEPPVHLPYMAEALTIMWEEEGLYN